MTVALQIRDVPEDVRDALAELARQRGQSLQAFLLALVERESRFARNVALLHQFDDRADGVPDTEADAGLVALEQARGQRERTP